MGPYTTPLEKITDVSPYFKKNDKDNSITFIGDSLEICIPAKFSNHGMLEIGEFLTTLGIFNMVINDRYQAGMNILGQISMFPSDFGKKTYKGISYVTATFKEGDVFISNTKILQDQHVVYILWTEFITNGGLPFWMDYQATLAIFAHAKELTGAGIGVTRSVFEGIIAHLSRDRDDIRIPYRLTSMKKPFKMIALKSVSQATSNSSSKLIGSYFRDEGVTSALRYQSDQQQPFENLLRGLSNFSVEQPRDSES